MGGTEQGWGGCEGLSDGRLAQVRLLACCRTCRRLHSARCDAAPPPRRHSPPRPPVTPQRVGSGRWGRMAYGEGLDGHSRQSQKYCAHAMHRAVSSDSTQAAHVVLHAVLLHGTLLQLCPMDHPPDCLHVRTAVQAGRDGATGPISQAKAGVLGRERQPRPLPTACRGLRCGRCGRGVDGTWHNVEF